MQVLEKIKVLAVTYVCSASALLATTEVSTDHMDLVMTLGLIAGGILAFAAGISRWVVEPSVTKGISQHNENKGVHVGAFTEHNTAGDSHINLVLERREEFHKVMDKLSEAIQNFTLVSNNHISITKSNSIKLDNLLEEHNNIKGSYACRAATPAPKFYSKRAGDPEGFDPVWLRKNNGLRTLEVEPSSSDVPEDKKDDDTDDSSK